jgi:hypothetical protein
MAKRTIIVLLVALAVSATSLSTACAEELRKNNSTGACHDADFVSIIAHHAQYVYTMRRVSKTVPPQRTILKNISLNFFPARRSACSG